MENTKILQCVSANNIKEIVNIANTLNISREDMVSIIPKDNKVYMVYYYDTDRRN